MTLNRRALLAAGAAAPLASCASWWPRKRERDELAWIDGVETARLIRRGDISRAEAVDAAIRRVEAMNPRLNFLVTPDFDRAREAARAGPPNGPFAGQAMLIKDLSNVQGLPTRHGARGAAEAGPAPATDANPAAVLASGFTCIGKSSTPEFGFLPTTEPLADGPTRNPWDTGRSSGGSSGGAAAAVAAGVIPVAHASDGGGSIRIPAACCGVFGLKPSRGRMIGDRAAATDLSVKLCVSRSVRDTAVLYAATERTAGPGALPAVGLIEGPDRRRLKIGFVTHDPLGRRADPEVRDAIERTAALLEQLGHTVEEARWPFDATNLTQDFLSLWAQGAVDSLAVMSRFIPPAEAEASLEPFSKGLVEFRRGLRKKDFDAAVARMTTLHQQYRPWFQTHDVVLSPVLPSVAPPLGHISGDVAFETLLERLGAYAAYTPVVNVIGNPAMSVPLFQARGGLPVGSHFQADIGREDLLLRLAFELEAARPWAGRRAPTSVEA